MTITRHTRQPDGSIIKLPIPTVQRSKKMTGGALLGNSLLMLVVAALLSVAFSPVLGALLVLAGVCGVIYQLSL